jgi:hypothetical protein
VQDVKSPESWSTEAEKAMNSVQKIFEVDYVTRGTLKNVVIAANDFEQAAKAASVKLAMIRTTTEFDILAIRRRTSVLTSNQEMNLDQVDAVSALSELARIMHKYPTFEDGENGMADKVFFLSVQCLSDHGYDVSPELWSSFERLLDDADVAYSCGIDQWDPERPPMAFSDCLQSVSWELYGEWRPIVCTEDGEEDYMYATYRQTPRADTPVDLTENTIAYCFLLAVGALSNLGIVVETLATTAVELMPKFIDANPRATPPAQLESLPSICF